MILVDTSVWIDHFSRFDPLLFNLLTNGFIATHPFVLGELAMGSLTGRSAALFTLHQLPQLTVGKDPEVLGFIERQALFGTGIGYIDAHLLVSAKLTPGTQLWTRDRRLRTAATRLSIAYSEA